MRITPIDIETRRFPMQFRGFHPEEVSSFLEQIREELEDLLRENAALKERIHKADDEMRRFWEMQDLLSRTLQDAQQMSEEYKIHARREVEAVIEKAEETVRDMIGEAHAKARQINEEINELKLVRKEFHEGIKNILRHFETVMAGERAFQQEIVSDGTDVAARPDNGMTSAADTDELLMTEDQISVIEGHGGEEGGSESEQQ